LPEWVEVSTQQELDAALNTPTVIPVCNGEGTFVVNGPGTVRAADSANLSASGEAVVEAGGSASVEASGSCRVEAWDEATVTARDSVGVTVADTALVDASGSATVRALRRARVVARGGATVEAEHFTSVSASGTAHVMAWQSASVEASGDATVLAWGGATVTASERARVRAWGRAKVGAKDEATVEVWDRAIVTGADEAGQAREIQQIASAEDWCRLYGVQVQNGVAILYKAVDEDFRSRYGTSYEPGSEPQAADWDERRKCGGGLHFSPRPYMGLEFTQSRARFVACPVRLDDIAAWGGPYPNKVKARGVCAPVYEVDENGNAVADRPGE
jgi:hypothetical protein